MRESFSDEHLSAYVDGELPPRERAEVEQWLESSPEARQKLEGFRRLSSLFASLPRTEVPQEFPTKVLQLAERRMLLPDVVAVSAKRRFYRRIVAVGGAVASAAAVLFVAMHFRHPGMPPNVAFRDAPPAPGMNLPASGPAGRDIRGGQKVGDLVAARESPDREAQSPPMPSAASADDKPSSGSTRPETATATEERGGTNPQVAGGRSDKRFPLKPEVSQNPKDNGTSAAGRRTNPRIAEFSREMYRLGDAEDVDEHLSVVTIHIDHAEGMMLVQKMLVNNNVFPAGTREAGEKLDGKVVMKSRADAGAPSGDFRECLIVIAEPEKVVAALTEILEREDAGIRLTVEAPLEIAALDAESQKLLKPAEADSDSHVPSVAPATSEKKKQADAVRGESARSGPSSLRKESPKADSSLAKRKEPADGRNSDRAAPGQALQFVAPVPKEIATRQLAAATARPQASRDLESLEILATPPPKAGSLPSDNGKGEAEREQARRMPAMVRVLFMIEPAEARPAAPLPADKAPADKAPSGKGPAECAS